MAAFPACCAARGTDLVLRLRVRPRASPEGIAGVRADRLQLRVGAAPVDGAANARVISLLADELGIARSRIAITRGETSRDKELLLAGGVADALPELQDLLAKLEKP